MISLILNKKGTQYCSCFMPGHSQKDVQWTWSSLLTKLIVVECMDQNRVLGTVNDSPSGYGILGDREGWRHLPWMQGGYEYDEWAITNSGLALVF